MEAQEVGYKGLRDSGGEERRDREEERVRMLERKAHEAGEEP